MQSKRSLKNFTMPLRTIQLRVLRLTMVLKLSKSHIKSWTKLIKMNRERLFGSGNMILFLSLFLAGCVLINPSETIPARIQIEPMDLEVVEGQGSDQHKITEVWVFADGDFLGAFYPPTEIPYIGDSDQTTFSFRAGIRNNGIASDAIVYPMYTHFNLTLNTTSGTITQVTPITHYQPGTVFSLIADFESKNEFVDNRDTVAASMVTRSMDSPFEGNYSGEIIMSESAYFIEVGNAIQLGNIPTDGTPSYLEFQYKSEKEMSIGVLGITLDGQQISNFFYLVKPSDNWNMLYIELTDILQISDFPAYKILFRSAYPSDATKPELKIQLDNIKVVHL